VFLLRLVKIAGINIQHVTLFVFEVAI